MVSLNHWYKYYYDKILVLAFSALRAYALSNRNVWLAVMIVILALPPSALFIVSVLNVAGCRYSNEPYLGKIQCIYKSPSNLPSPLNCTSSTSLMSPTRSLRWVQHPCIFPDNNT